MTPERYLPSSSKMCPLGICIHVLHALVVQHDRRLAPVIMLVTPNRSGLTRKNRTVISTR